jgi:cytoplasmic iron level regulating protein YaaA (DUF328/UPF0246 family)
MLILLPPSETKRDGGDGPPLSHALTEHSLAFSELDSVRGKVAKAVVSLAKKPKECATALKLSPKQLGEIDRNRDVLDSATMPAMDRYTGVLYDGLAAINLPESSREFLAQNVMIHSAVLGPVSAGNLIPAYRLSFDSKLSVSGKNLKATWSGAVAKALSLTIETENPLVLDLRSEGYSALGPLAPSPTTFYLRVVTKGENGQLKALNHFNKKGKGEFLRALALDADQTSQINTLEDLMSWAATRNIILELGKQVTSTRPAELNLVVSGVITKQC